MRRALAVITAILVSIIWLGMIVGVPALALTGQLQRLIPVDLVDLDAISAQLGVDVTALTELAGLPSGDIANGEPVIVIPTETPIPEEPTPAPPTETPTQEPTPTSTPTVTPTPEPEVEPSLTVTDTVVLTDTSALTDTAGVTSTIELTTTEILTTTEVVPTPTVEPQRAIVASTANLRSGPGLDFEVVGSLEPPALISLVGQDPTGEWFLMTDGNWIFGALLTETPDVPVIDPNATPTETPVAVETPVDVVTPTVEVEATQTVTATLNADANLRSGPGTDFEVVAGAPFGSVVTVVGRVEAGDWYLLSDGNWVFATLLGDPITDVPIVDAEGNILSGPNQGRSVLDLTSSVTTPSVTTPALTATSPLTTTAALTSTSTLTDTAVTDTAVITTTPATTDTAGGQPSVNAPANLRSAPNTDAEIVGSAEVGTVLSITGRNAVGDWYQLADSSWIFAALVANPPADVPVVNQ